MLGSEGSVKCKEPETILPQPPSTRRDQTIIAVDMLKVKHSNSLYMQVSTILFKILKFIINTFDVCSNLINLK